MAHDDDGSVSRGGDKNLATFETSSRTERLDDDEKDSVRQVVMGLPPEPSVDGGARAWLQIVGSFLVFSNLWGFIFAFGSFQSYYEITYFPDESSSAISWIGTVASFLLILIGVISGPLFDMGYFKTMLFVGAGGETLAVFMMSFCKKYWQMLLAQGVLIGLANGLLYLPGLALVGRSFKKHRAVAMGIATCGAPTGGVIYTLVFEQLISRLGWSWMIRVMGFIMLGSYLIAFPLILWGADNLGDISAGTKRKLVDVTAFRDLPFWAYTISNFLIFCGYMTPFIFIASYGQRALGLSRSLSLHVIMITQAASVLGRLVSAYVATKMGVMLPWFVCVLVSAVMCIAWIGAKTTASYIAVAGLYGGFSGALIPLPPSLFPIVCPDKRVLGARLGMAQGIGSLASLVGPPIAAALADMGKHENGTVDYLGLQLFAGLVMLCGAINLIGLWILLIKKRDVKLLV
ncbi:hypothetical protein DV735_g896, partial [Chaetothyriales sp. CBS 134920]